jgi:hypothetical protein
VCCVRLWKERDTRDSTLQVSYYSVKSIVNSFRILKLNTKPGVWILISIFVLWHVRFPLDDENRLHRWTHAANRGITWNPTKYSVMYSSHFKSLEFDSKRRLLSDPTLIPSTSSNPVEALTFPIHLTMNRLPLTVHPSTNGVVGNGVIVKKRRQISETVQSVKRVNNSVACTYDTYRYMIFSLYFVIMFPGPKHWMPDDVW